MKQVTNKTILHRLPHYVVAGVVTLAVEYGAFLGLFYILKLSAVLANTISFVAALAVNFLLNRQWVFRGGVARRTWQKQTAFYLGLALLNLTITNTGLYYLLQLSLPAFAVKLLFVCLVASWNFVIFKKFIFTKSMSANKHIYDES